MQALLPPSLVIAATPLPQAGPSTPSAPSARATTNNEASFSRQLEQTRQARAQQSARPASPEPAPKAPAPPPPAATASARNVQADSAQRNEATRASARAAAARKGDAPAPKAESGTTDAPSDAAESDSTQQTPSASAGELMALLCPAPEPAAVPVEPARAAATSATLAPADLAAAAADAAASAAAGAAAAATAAGPAALPQALPNDAAGRAAAPAMLASAGPEAALTLPAQPAARDPRDASGNDTTAIAAGAEPTLWQQAQAAALAENNPPAREGLDARRGERATPLDSNDRALAPLGAAGPAGPTTQATKAAEVAQASLATPATSAEFRAALGAQVSIFARAGVQQAELHLNPAELGPVSIQIVLDGQQAQVNFGADSPLTRQIIESGMPELAGALRDAGLTLTGGGVSQHAGGQRQDGNPDGSAGGATRAQSDTSAGGSNDAQVEQIRRSAVRVAQGGVDFYA